MGLPAKIIIFIKNTLKSAEQGGNADTFFHHAALQCCFHPLCLFSNHSSDQAEPMPFPFKLFFISPISPANTTSGSLGNLPFFSAVYLFYHGLLEINIPNSVAFCP